MKDAEITGRVVTLESATGGNGQTFTRIFVHNNEFGSISVIASGSYADTLKARVRFGQTLKIRGALRNRKTESGTETFIAVQEDGVDVLKEAKAVSIAGTIGKVAQGVARASGKPYLRIRLAEGNGEDAIWHTILVPGAAALQGEPFAKVGKKMEVRGVEVESHYIRKDNTPASEILVVASTVSFPGQETHTGKSARAA